MIKFSKKKLPIFNYANNFPLLPSKSEGKKNIVKKELKKNQDMNGMQITYYGIRKNTISLWYDN